MFFSKLFMYHYWFNGLFAFVIGLCFFYFNILLIPILFYLALVFIPIDNNLLLIEQANRPKWLIKRYIIFKIKKALRLDNI